jgi:Zn-dependent protease with chaperone function
VDLTVLINHSSPTADATIRAGRKAWLVLSDGVFRDPRSGRFVLAHELAHLLRNDSYRGRVGGYLLRMLIPAALISFTPAAWAIMAASFLLHWVAIRWPAEIACDRIAARLTSYSEMVSVLDLRGWRRYVPLPWWHPPIALRLALGIPRADRQRPR